MKKFKLKEVAFIFLYFPLIMNCQNSQFIENLHYKNTVSLKGLSNNPYTLITECFFDKTIHNEVLWGSSRVNDNYYFNSLILLDNKTQQYKIDFKEVKSKVSKQDYEDLQFYGFASLAKTKLFVEFNVGNKIYFFKENNNQLIFDKTIYINDSIAFAYTFANTDSTLILLDYRAAYEGVAKIKAYSFNFRTSDIHQVFEKEMTSNSACFDRTNTRFYDANKNY